MNINIALDDAQKYPDLSITVSTNQTLKPQPQSAKPVLIDEREIVSFLNELEQQNSADITLFGCKVEPVKGYLLSLWNQHREFLKQNAIIERAS